jgi:hypothetical protein
MTPLARCMTLLVVKRDEVPYEYANDSRSVALAIVSEWSLQDAITVLALTLSISGHTGRSCAREAGVNC